MNPETNKFEGLKYLITEKYKTDDAFEKALAQVENKLIRPNGESVPKHWSVFAIDEEIVIKDYTFKVVYINESSITFEPVGPVIINKGE
jgi:hypothetical protein